MVNGTRLFRVFGIDVRLHFSWWFIFILLAWSLALSFFPEKFPGYSNWIYWLMGTTASLLLFLSVLLHELSHSLVAKAVKIKVENITLFFFGGVASIEKEEMKPLWELLMALAGPLFSFALAGIFYALYLLSFNGVVTAISFYLATINSLLAFFNLVPAFPLDGGRALRAILYAWSNDLKRATYIASLGGKIFAGYMILEGFLNFFGVVFLLPGGLWFILLGAFLYLIAGMSYEQVVIRAVLKKIPVTEILSRPLPVVSAKLKFKEFIEKETVWEEDAFLVRSPKFTGLLEMKRLEKIPPRLQSLVSLRELAVPLEEIKALKKGDNAYAAFRRFAQQNLDLLPVRDGQKNLGFLQRRALMHRLVWELKMEDRGKKNERL